MASGSENLQEQITPALKAALPQAMGTEVRAWPEQGHLYVLQRNLVITSVDDYHESGPYSV